jgi:hypothetical protein
VRRKAFLLMTVAGVVASRPAMADLILVGPEVVSGSGFGALPRALTIQSHGPNQNSESGCIAPDGGGGLIAGSGACAPLDGVTGGNEQNPIGFPKQAAPTLSALGITNANQIGILFDAVQPQNGNNSVVTINDLTLKLYNGTQLVSTASGTFSPLSTNPGNGQTDYLFTLNATEAATFNAAIAGNFGDRIALDSTISFPRQSAGPDSFALVNTTTLLQASAAAAIAIPEPTTILLIGSGLLGLELSLRKCMTVKSD